MLLLFYPLLGRFFWVRFLRIPLPRTARILDFHDSLSLLFLLFSRIFFYPQRLSYAEALETGRLCGGIHNCIEKGLCHEDIVVSVNSMLKSFFTDFIHTENAPFRWRYEEDLKQIYQGHLP